MMINSTNIQISFFYSLITILFLNNCKVSPADEKIKEDSFFLCKEAIAAIKKFEKFKNIKLEIGDFKNKNEISSDYLKKILEALSDFLEKNSSLFDAESDFKQLEAYYQIQSLIKMFKNSPFLKKEFSKELEKLIEAFDSSTRIINIELEIRNEFNNIVSSLGSLDSLTTERLQTLLNKYPHICTLKKDDGKTLLHEQLSKIPVKKDKTQDDIGDGDEEVKILIERLKIIVKHILSNNKYLDILKSKDNQHLTPMHIAAKQNRISELVYEIQEGQKYKLTGLTIENYYLGTNNPLHMATSHHNKDAAMEILKHNPKLIYEVNERGRNPLHVLTIAKNIDMTFINAFVNNNDIDINYIKKAINTLDNNDETPLHNFIRLCKTEADLSAESHPVVIALNTIIKKKLFDDAKSLDEKKKINKETIRSSLLKTLDDNKVDIKKNKPSLYNIILSLVKKL